MFPHRAQGLRRDRRQEVRAYLLVLIC
jgi:hypothetical protein